MTQPQQSVLGQGVYLRQETARCFHIEETIICVLTESRRRARVRMNKGRGAPVGGTGGGGQGQKKGNKVSLFY